MRPSRAAAERKTSLGVGMVVALLISGCQDTAPATREDEAAGPSTESSVVTSPAVPADDEQGHAQSPMADAGAGDYVTVLCAGLGELTATTERMEGMDLSNVEHVDPADAVALQTFSDEVTTVLSTLRDSVDGTSPDFEGGDELAQRTAGLLADAEQLARQISATIRSLDPAAPDYGFRLTGQAIGFLGVALPLLQIIAAKEVIVDGAAPGNGLTEEVIASPGSLAFYREARDKPGCAWMFTTVDRATLDALVDGGGPAGSGTTGELDGSAAVGANIAEVDIAQLAIAEVPSLCDHEPGQLANGRLPVDDPSAGFVSLVLQPAGGVPGPLLADVTGDGRTDAVVVAECSAGGVSWPMHLLLYGPGPEFLGAVDLGPHTAGFEHADVSGLTADGSDVAVTWAGYDGAGGNPLLFAGTLRYDGTQLQLVDSFAVG
ncbi:hypothetical protein [Blastococcus montanus]|uniref:hypothetical protein n=1 Tax=Blastococcus montanus TaxID=3144973 RepID=UPI00320B78F6